MMYRQSSVYIQVKEGCLDEDQAGMGVMWVHCLVQTTGREKRPFRKYLCASVTASPLRAHICLPQESGLFIFFQNSMLIFFHQDPEKLHMLVCICCRMCLRSWQLSYASTSGHPLYLCKFISFGAEIKAGESSGSAQDESYQVPLKLSFLLSYVSLSLCFSPSG